MANNYGTHPLKKLGEVTPEMVEKLPQWAQRHLQLLEMRLGEAKRELHRHLTANPKSEFAILRPTAIASEKDGPQEAFLPANLTLFCYLDDNVGETYHERKTLSLRRSGDKSTGYWLEVSAWANYPSIQPQASNVFRIRLGDHP
jgi:hypothetical protein